ncbi:MAG: hypothetical protein OXU81_09475 [Gammaproteobacteria bacterium]|nr:hypothetical protein [Gammaproteobacteria bacterium]
MERNAGFDTAMQGVAARAVRAGETLDVVLSLDECGGIFARAGPRVEGEGRLAALAFAPGLALLARIRLGIDGVLETETLATRLAGLPTPGALIEALAPALAYAEMDRDHGGLLFAAPDTDGHGGLVDAHGFAEVQSKPRDALTRGLVRVVDGCVHRGGGAPRWTRRARRLVLMRGDVLEVSVDVAGGTAALGRAGEPAVAEVRLADASGAGRPRIRFPVPSGDALCVDVDALYAFLAAPPIRGLVVEGRSGGVRHEALVQRIDAAAVGAVVRPAPSTTTTNYTRS